jgi:uncharacterized membrane protein
MNTIFFVIHVALAVFIVGPMSVLPMTALRAIRMGHSQTVKTLGASTRIYTLLSILVALVGFAVVGTTSKEDAFRVSTPWILASIIIYLVALAISLFVVVPSLRGAGEAMSAAPADAIAAGAPFRARVAAGSGIVSVLLLVIVVLMVWQP